MPSIIHRRPRKRLALAVLLAADALMFDATEASRVASFMLIVGFLLLMATIYCVLYAILTAARWYGVTIKRRRRLAAALTGLAGCLVALQSVGGLNVRDVLVLLPLAAIGYVYSFYSARSGRQPDA